MLHVTCIGVQSIISNLLASSRRIIIRRCLGLVSHFMNNPGCSALNHSAADCNCLSLFFFRFLCAIATGISTGNNKTGSAALAKSAAVAAPGVRHLIARKQ